MFKSKVQSDLDCAPICFQRLVQQELSLVESRRDDGTYDRRPVPSPTEFRMCENTRISSVVVPGSIPGHRRDSTRVEVRHHVMRDLIETAALLPFVGPTFSAEAIHRSRVVAPDESDVAGRGRLKSIRLQTALERRSDHSFEVFVEQLHEERLLE
jgi:hypothetical protein